MRIGASIFKPLTSSEMLLQLESLCEYELKGSQECIEIKYLGDPRYISKNALFFADESYLTLNYENCFVLVEEFPKILGLKNIYCKVADRQSVFIDYVNKFLQGSLLFGGTLSSISDLARISSSAVIEEGVCIGDNVIVGDNVVIKSGTSIGCNCIISEGCCIGGEGVSRYKGKDGVVRRRPHIAGVEIGNGVEIGANSVISKGIFYNTEIGDNVVLGNLCNVGHSARLGDSVWASSGVIIAGLTDVGSFCSIGIGSIIKDGLTIGENVSIGMGSVVIKNIMDNVSVFGNPAKKVGPIKSGPDR